jgi:hypothetical protein
MLVGYNVSVMIDAFLLPQSTVVTANGDSAPVELSAAGGRVFLLTLWITGVIEQESFDLSLFTSADGIAWDAKPFATLPQKFYAGEYPLLVDLTASPEAKFIRAHWDVNRWGRGAKTPHFEAGVRFREVPAEMLRDGSIGKSA